MKSIAMRFSVILLFLISSQVTLADTINFSSSSANAQNTYICSENWSESFEKAFQDESLENRVQHGDAQCFFSGLLRESNLILPDFLSSAAVLAKEFLLDQNISRGDLTFSATINPTKESFVYIGAAGDLSYVMVRVTFVLK